MPEWVDLIVSILSGLVVMIPLVVKLIEYVGKATKEKNWPALLELITNYMEDAEQKFATGAERKDYVVLAIKASADTLNYEIDLELVSKLIDDLCAMSKKVNAPKLEESTEEVSEQSSLNN